CIPRSIPTRRSSDLVLNLNPISLKTKNQNFQFFQDISGMPENISGLLAILNVPKIAQLFLYCNTFVSLTVSEIPIARNEKFTTLDRKSTSLKSSHVS